MRTLPDLDGSLPEGCVSDLAIDRLLAGETVEGAAAHLRRCAACASRRDAIAADAAAFRADRRTLRPPDAAEGAAALRPVRRLEPVGEPGRSQAQQWAARAAIPALALAASVAVVAVMLPSSPPEGFARKGGGSISLIARTAEGKVDRILPGDPLSPGDAIRFEVTSAGSARVWIVGLDAAGAVTAYAEDYVVEGGAATVLPGSVVLDGTLGVERIVALLCDDRVETERVLAAGRAALESAGGDPSGDLSLDVPGCLQSSLLIRKAGR